MRKIQMDCLPGLSGRLAHLQSSNILTKKMKSLLPELNMRYFNSANRYQPIFLKVSFNFHKVQLKASVSLILFVTTRHRAKNNFFAKRDHHVTHFCKVCSINPCPEPPHHSFLYVYKPLHATAAQ